MNPNILAIGGDLSMMVAKTDEQAVQRLGVGGGFFSFGIMHYYMTGMHTPGRTGVWDRYLDEVKADPTLAYGPGRGAIGSPDTVREFLRGYEESGVDEIILLLNPRSHEGTMESIELMGKRGAARVHRARREARGGEGQAARARAGEARSAPRGVDRTRLRRELLVRRAADRSGRKVHRQ